MRSLLPLALLCELLALASQLRPLSILSGVLLLIFFAWHWRSLMPYPRRLALVALALAGTWLALQQPSWEQAARLASSAAYYGAFVGALGLMHCLVERLPQLGELHRLLLRGPKPLLYPGYLLSSFAISSILSFGMLNLVCGSLDGHMRRQRIEGRERREGMRGVMVTALRGYALVPLLAPTSVGVAILTRELPGLTWAALLPYGGIAALLLLALGWFADNRRLRLLSKPGQDGEAPAEPVGSLGLVVGCSLLGIALIAALAAFTWLSATQAAMLLVPVSVALFLLFDNRSPRATLGEIGDTALGMRNEIFIFACSAVIGGLVGLMVPVEQLVGHISITPLLLFLIGLFGMLGIMGLALVGVAPIISMSICASLLAQLSSHGVDPLPPAVALLSGFSLAMLISPYGASALLLGRYAQLSPWRVAVVWNGRFVLLALIPLGLLQLIV